MKSYIATPKDIKRDWYVVDAADKTLGRLSSAVATVLRGKHKPTFTPFLDTGDYVIVINAEKVKLTGKKDEQKVYLRHTGYPGGLKETSVAAMRENKPEEIVRHAVKGMLPKGKLGRKMFKKLRVYKGAEHGHAGQKPLLYEIKE